jgi:hypothetical protein
MKTVRGFALGVLFVVGFVVRVYAMEVLEPTAGEVYYPDSKVRVVVKPSSGENIVSVGIGFDEVPFDNSLGAFVREFPMPTNALTGEVEFVVEALTESHEILTVSRKINIKLPPSVKLESIEIDPALLFLQKLPVWSDANKIRIYGTERIGVAGVYSDGYKRDIASAALGTIYRSSDESIVTVDTEGLATAKNTGLAKIFISNSGKEITVDVIVKEVSN